jgi:ABC-type transport system substrate-binding protein
VVWYVKVLFRSRVMACLASLQPSITNNSFWHPLVHISVSLIGTPQQLTSWSCDANGKFILETKDKFYPLLQELTYIRPLTFASATAFAQGINSDPDEHNSCNSGDFGSAWSHLEVNTTCLGLKEPIGTGAFKLVTQETNEDGVDIAAVFARHDDYWGSVPEIEFMHIKYYEDTADVERDLLSGDLDMALGIGPLQAKQLQNLRSFHSDKVEVRHSEVLQHALLVMNTNADHTKDIKTRQAIIHAVDKSKFIEEEFAGLEQPVSQLLPFNAPYCDVDLSPKWAYDFQKAELLNCANTASTNKDLGGGAIAGISIASVVLVGLIGLVTRMYIREKQGKPIFSPIEQEKEIA